MPELSRILIALAWAVGAFGAGVWLYSKKERQMAELL
jgi:hypothetical protein